MIVTLPDGHKVDIPISDVAAEAWGVLGTCQECGGTGEDWMSGNGYCMTCNGYGILLCQEEDEDEVSKPNRS